MKHSHTVCDSYSHWLHFQVQMPCTCRTVIGQGSWDLMWSMQRVSSGARGRPASVVQHTQRFDKFSRCNCAALTNGISVPLLGSDVCPAKLFPRMRRFNLSFMMTLCALHLCRQATKPWISRFLQPSTRLQVPILSGIAHARSFCTLQEIARRFTHIVPSVFDLLLHNRLNFWRISFYSEI